MVGANFKPLRRKDAAAVAGVIIAWFQWDQARKNAKTQDNVERPWVRSTAIIDGTGQVTVGYRNSGPTPTTLTPLLYARFVSHPLKPEEAMKWRYLSDELSVNKPTGAAIMMIAADTEKWDASRIPKQYVSATDIKDLNGRYLKAQSDVVDQLTKNILYVWGVFLYQDGLGKEHEGKFCYEIL